MAGKINYIDDDGRERYSKFAAVDLSKPNIISFTTLDKGVVITIPVTRLIKIKEVETSE